MGAAKSHAASYAGRSASVPSDLYKLEATTWFKPVVEHNIVAKFVS